jgi:hypothetical protein
LKDGWLKPRASLDFKESSARKIMSQKRTLTIASFHIFPHYSSVPALEVDYVKSGPLQTSFNEERRNINLKRNKMDTRFRNPCNTCTSICQSLG